MHFIISFIRATCLAHPILPELITQITIDYEVTNYEDPAPAKRDKKQIMLKDRFLSFFLSFFLTTIAEWLPFAGGTTAISFPLNYQQNSFLHAAKSRWWPWHFVTSPFLSILLPMSFNSNYIDEPQNVLQFNICQDTHDVRLRQTCTESI